MQVFTAQATDDRSSLFKHFGEDGDHNYMNVYVAGNLGGGTITVEAQTPDGLSWVPVAGGEITVPGMHVIDAGPFIGSLNLVGATGASVNAWVESDSQAARDRVADATI